MKAYLMRGSAAALILSCSAQVALADLTARDVWSDWRDYMTGAGYQLTADESMSGNTLSVRDLTLAIQLPENGGLVSIRLEELALTENGDGSVSLVMPERMPIRIDTTGGEAEVKAVFNLLQSGASLRISGTPDDMTQDYKAATATIAYDNMTVDGDPLPPEAMRAGVTLRNISTSTHMLRGENRSYDQTGGADMLDYDLAFQDPNSEDMGAFKGSVQDLRLESKSVIPTDLNADDLSQMLRAGFGFDARISFGAGSGSASGKGEGEEFTLSSTSQGGAVAVAMNGGHVSYDVSQDQTEITVQTAEVPFPISFAMQKIGFALDLPLARSDEEQPFSFGLTLAEFTMPEQLWGIFDPGAVLPRDPATVVVDLAGKVRLLADLLDPAIAESDAAPGELNALTIKDLQISAAGASLTGTGDFIFDNTDMESFDGVPAPEGTADLKLVGANGLIDKLIQMGLMSDQDAMGARMTMGMIGVPGDAPDTLNSHIEINHQRQILANGQRLK